MVPQLISTRQESIDLRAVGDLQQRINKLDNLAAGLYDRDFAMEAQQQEQMKQKEKLDETPVAPAIPKRGRPFTDPSKLTQAQPVMGFEQRGRPLERELFTELGISSVREISKPRAKKKLVIKDE
jgi:hypothetical protein